ncbi:MAG: hypothetical protein MUF23_10885 [Pirellula sp.]|nr:hypothetical protein [Pirellula sp.]
MTHPSLASDFPRLQETQSAHVATRIDLLGPGGQVELSWGLGNGRWSLGSGPRNDVRISDDPSIAECHILLTVGKRYTLLKAVGPIRIAGRPIREWLIDQSTLVECGGRWLVIHPNKQTSLAVVTHDRLSEIAERLASLNPPSIPSSAPEPGKDSESIVAEFRQEVIQDLFALRETVSAIHAKIEELPDVSQLESRIEQRTLEALQALKEELPQRLGDPIREELTELIRSQRSTWDEELNSRHNQIEASIQAVAAGVDHSQRDTREHLELFQSQLAKLAHEQGDLRELFSRLENAQSESQATLDRLSIARSEKAADVTPSLPPTFAPATDFVAHEFAATHFAAPEIVAPEIVAPEIVAPEIVAPEIVALPTEFSSLSLSSEPTEFPVPTELSATPLTDGSDEVFEFQVDDESISQRLSRMLSEPHERRSTTTRSKLSEEVEGSSEVLDPLPSSDLEAAVGEQLDPDALYTALSELNAPNTDYALTSEDVDRQSPLPDYVPAELEPTPYEPTPYEPTPYEPTELGNVHDADERVATDDFGSQDIEAPGDERVEREAVFSKESQSNFESPNSSLGKNADEGTGDEDSIEEYMQRLLHRVRTGGNAGDSAAVGSAVPVNQSVEQNDRVSAARGSSGVYGSISGNSVGGANVSVRSRLTADDSNPPSSRTRNEVKSDIEALREIANSNARRAINRSVIRRKRSNVIIKGAVVVISLVCAIAMFLMNGFRVTATLGGFIISLVIAVLWGFDTAREAMSLFDEKKQREADNQSDLLDASLDTPYTKPDASNE